MKREIRILHTSLCSLAVTEPVFLDILRTEQIYISKENNVLKKLVGHYTHWMYKFTD